MSSVDERIVQMRFDNKQFENGIQTSIKSLEDLKKGLKLEEAAQSLDNLDRAGRRFSLSGISDGIDIIKSKFSALSIIGITALANITNSAVNAGRRLASSFTLGPIKAGFSEYETKMGAIQTILTNTQGGQRRVTDQAMSAIKQTSSATIGAVQEANDSAVKSLQKSHDQELKYYEKTTDEELDLLDKKFDKESEDLQKANDYEMKLLRKSHDEKLKMYDQEYMGKLKAVDEERYNKIKEIDNQIKGINDLTDAEDEEIRKKKEADRIQELQNRINTTKNTQDKAEAEKELADYINTLNRNKLIKERELAIEALRIKKDDINNEYDTIKDNLKEEYNAKKENENDLYALASENLRNEQDEKIKKLRETHTEEKKLINERITMEKDALKERLDAEMDALQKRNKASEQRVQGSSGGGGTSGAVEKWETVKGSTLDEVNAALSDLNNYADKTIYNFAQMTDNIGKMTAAGVGLKDSVNVVKGMANVAAGFGVDATKMAGATYQMSQALAAGRVQLMDWKSMEQAGMGGPMLQNALMETAKSMGIVVKAGKPFRETLNDGWLTTDVFVKTMDRMANDPNLLKAATNVTSFTKLLDVMRESIGSGWATTWEQIFGNKDQSTELFTNISNGFNALIQPSTDARNAMLAFWNANGGRDAIIEAISNSFNLLGSMLKPIGQAFREVFPRMTGERLTEISKVIRDLTTSFKIGEDASSNLKDTFKGLFSVLDIGVKAFKLLTSGLGMLVKAIIPVSNPILEVTGSIGRFLTAMNESIEKSDLFTFAIENISIGFTMAKDGITTAIDAISTTLPKIGKALTDITNAFKGLFTPTTAYATTLDDTGASFTKVEQHTNNFRTALEKIGVVLSVVKDGIVKVAGAVGKVLGPIFDSIKKKFDSFSVGDIGALLTGGGLLMFAKTLNKGLSSIDSILKNFSAILGEVSKSLQAFQKKVKAEALLKIAIALGILAAALIALSFIKIEDLAKSLGALTLMFIGLSIALRVLGKQSAGIQGLKNMFGQIGSGLQIMGFATGILILAGALKILSTIDTAGLIRGGVALVALMGALILFMKLTKNFNLKASAAGLISFSIGIAILAGSLAILAQLDFNKLGQGVAAIGTLMLMIATFIKFTQGGDLAASAGGLIGFAIGITILCGALSILGNLNQAKLIQGGEALAAMMGVIFLFIQFTRGGDLATSAGGLVGFAIGISLLTASLSILGNLDPAKLEQGGKALIGMMVAIGAFIKLTRGGDLAASAGGLIGFSIGLIILTGALSILGNMDFNKLKQGVEGIASIMGALFLFIKFTNGGDLATSSAGLIAFSVGLVVMSGAVSILASIDPKRIWQGVGAIVGMMTAIGAFVSLTKEGDLKGSSAGLIGFATGLLIIAGVLAILSALNTEKLVMASVALSAVIAAIAAFTNLSSESDLKATAGALVVFSVAIGIMAASLFLLSQLNIGQILLSAGAITGLILAIAAFTTLTSGADILATAAGLVIFSGALMVLSQVIIQLGSVDIMTMLVGIGALALALAVLGLTATILAPLTPVMLGLSAAMLLFGLGIAAAGVGVLAFSKGISELAVSGKAGGEALVEIIKGLIALIPQTLIILATGIIEFAKTLGDGAPVIAEAAQNILLSIIDTIIKVSPKVMECIVTVGTAWLKTVVTMIPLMVDAGMKLILGLLKGVADNIMQITQAGIDIVLNFINGVIMKLQAIIDTAFRLIIAFINGLADAIDKNHNALYNAIGKLIDAIVKAITDLWPRLVKVGENIIKGFIQGFGNMAKTLVEAVKGVIGSAVDGVKDFLGIHSPSRVFAEIGKYSVMGFANGLNNFSGLAVDEAKNVGRNAMDSLRNAISNISDVVSGNMDMSPTIRPVLDLGNVTSGIGAMDSLFNRSRGITVNGAIDKASAIISRLAANNATNQNSSINQSVAGGDSTGNQPIYVTVVSQIDGREVARVTAPAMSEELHNISRRKPW